jgi:hypothetical protein
VLNRFLRFHFLVVGVANPEKWSHGIDRIHEVDQGRNNNWTNSFWIHLLEQGERHAMSPDESPSQQGG